MPDILHSSFNTVSNIVIPVAQTQIIRMNCIDVYYTQFTGSSYRHSLITLVMFIGFYVRVFRMHLRMPGTTLSKTASIVHSTSHPKPISLYVLLAIDLLMLHTHNPARCFVFCPWTLSDCCQQTGTCTMIFRSIAFKIVLVAATLRILSIISYSRFCAE